MMEIIAILTLVGLVSILLIKAYNIANGAKSYNTVVNMIMLGAAVVLWGIFTINYLSGISFEETSTIVDGASTITVTKQSNLYEYLLPYTYLMNSLLFLVLGLSFIEAILTIFPSSRGRYDPKKDSPKRRK